MNRRTALMDSSLTRQVPIAAIFLIAALLSVPLPDIDVTSLTALVWSVVVAALATALSIAPPNTRLGTLIFTVVPSIDFVAVALLRDGTGAGSSPFTALTVLPVLWLGSSHGRRHVLYALAGAVFVLLLPFALQPGTALNAAGVIRLVISIIVFGTVALVVNLLASQSRAQVLLSQEHEVLVQEEIDRAAAVQRSLLPDPDARISDDVSVAGVCLPATSVGGDFFDWYATDNGMAITLGDVMGKGVGAGLIASAVRAAVRSAQSVEDPAEALLRASDGLEVVGSSTDVTFTTLFHARLSGDGELRWADAGHGLSAIMRVDGAVEVLASQNLPLGLDIDDQWRSQATTLGPYELLVTVSDGVLDLFDGVDETIEGIAVIARTDPTPSAIVAALTELARSVAHDDDVTVVAIQREPAAVPV